MAVNLENENARMSGYKNARQRGAGRIRPGMSRPHNPSSKELDHDDPA